MAFAFNPFTGKLDMVGGGSTPTPLTVTEVEIDFGSVPVPSKSFVITEALASPTSKIIPSPSSKTATGRVGTDDMEWDMISLSAVPGSGSFTLYAVANPGPVVGKRNIQYIVG
jgi:hypothetical protein